MTDFNRVLFLAACYVILGTLAVEAARGGDPWHTVQHQADSVDPADDEVRQLKQLVSELRAQLEKAGTGEDRKSATVPTTPVSAPLCPCGCDHTTDQCDDGCPHRLRSSGEGYSSGTRAPRYVPISGLRDGHVYEDLSSGTTWKLDLRVPVWRRTGTTETTSGETTSGEWRLETRSVRVGQRCVNGFCTPIYETRTVRVKR